jgi:cation transporter-like permease
MGKNERNEKRKLTAALMNGICIAVVGVTAGTAAGRAVAHDGLWPLLGVAAIVVLTFHLFARAALGRIEE